MIFNVVFKRLNDVGPFSFVGPSVVLRQHLCVEVPGDRTCSSSVLDVVMALTGCPMDEWFPLDVPA